MLQIGKTRNQRLADHYLEHSGIAAVSILVTQDGNHIWGARRVVTIDRVDSLRLVCCDSFASALHLARAQYLYGNMTIEERAAMMGIGLSSHEDVIARALSAVDVVNAEVRRAQSDGSFRLKNSAFKAQRRHDPSLRYHDLLHRQKMLMLEVMAKEIRT